MNILKRSFISIYRQPVKSSIFFLLIALLSMVVSGSILVRQAIVNTDQNLRGRMPAISTIMYDEEATRLVYEETGEWSAFEIAQPELIRQIGEFPYVSMFDYSIDLREGVIAPSLNSWYNSDFSFSSLHYEQDLGLRLFIEGVSPIGFLEMRESFIELTHGRAFEHQDFDITEAPYPVLISSALAEANDLAVGSNFEMQAFARDAVITEDGIIMTLLDEPPLVETMFSVEIIGIFDPIFPTIPEGENPDDLFQATVWQARMHHRVFLPNFVAEMMFDVISESPVELDNIFFQNFFLLNDPMDFEAFDLAVRNLPGFWRATDFSSGFRSISASMINMQELANFIFFVATGATLLVTALLVLLFLRDRKHEIGVYLALGENKKKVVLQMILELIPLAMMAMTLALFTGSLIAPRLSREMLIQQMAQEQGEFLFREEGQPLEFFGYRFELLPEEMLESYEIGLDIPSIILFYSIGASVVLIATIIPIVYTTHINPKELLM